MHDILTRATSAPGLGTPLRHLHRDCAHPCRNCAGTGFTAATSAPGLGTPLPHLHRDCAHPGHICAGTGLTAYRNTSRGRASVRWSTRSVGAPPRSHRACAEPVPAGALRSYDYPFLLRTPGAKPRVRLRTQPAMGVSAMRIRLGTRDGVERLRRMPPPAAFDGLGTTSVPYEAVHRPACVRIRPEFPPTSPTGAGAPILPDVAP